MAIDIPEPTSSLEPRLARNSVFEAVRRIDIASGIAAGHTLADACERAEDQLVEAVPDVLWCSIAAMSRSAQRLARDRFRLDDTTYDVRVIAEPQDANVLCIVIGPAATRWTSPISTHIEASVSGSGRYQTVSLDAVAPLAKVSAAGAELVAAFLEDGYRRLAAITKRELLRADNDVAVDLYTEVRSALDESIASRVSLYAIVNDDQAMYMLDQAAIMEVVRRVSVARSSSGASPLALTALLVKGWVNACETVSIAALERDEPLAVRLADMHYETSPELGLAEKGWFGDIAHVQPIVTAGRLKLIAAYPSDLKSDVHQRLAAQRGRLTEVLSAYEKTARGLIRTREPRYALGWDRHLAELIGHVLRGYFPSP